MAVNAIVATVTIIFQLSGSQVIGTATGFFYERGTICFS